MSFNPNTHWAKGLVNLNQSKAERQAKYRHALILGANPALAHAMRDWRWAKIERAFGVENPKTRRELWTMKQ